VKRTKAVLVVADVVVDVIIVTRVTNTHNNSTDSSNSSPTLLNSNIRSRMPSSNPALLPQLMPIPTRPPPTLTLRMVDIKTTWPCGMLHWHQDKPANKAQAKVVNNPLPCRRRERDPLSGDLIRLSLDLD
jgi:hypothetical protein